MRLLTDDVIPHGFDLRIAVGENPITILPREIREVGRFGSQPQGLTAFDLLDHCGRLARAGQRAERMKVIFDAADNNGLAFEIGQDATEVTV